jgi:hypothetical protein
LQFFLSDDLVRNSWVKWSAIIISILTLVGFAIHRFLEFYGTNEKPFVDALLERLGSEIWERIPKNLEGPIERHRITLFKLKPRNRLSRWWFNSNWTHMLCPCVRSPKSGRRPRRKFKVHDHYAEKCEGIAGLVFASGNRSLISQPLPNLHEGPITDEKVRQYALLTNDQVDIVKREHYYSTVIGGVTVYKNGERWGVLILDSVDPNALVNRTLDGAAMQRTLALLVDVLS